MINNTKNNLVSIEYECIDNDWEQKFPILGYINNPFFKKVCIHKEEHSGGYVIKSIQLHSEYIFTVIKLESIRNEISKEFGLVKITNEKINPEYVEDFIKNGIFHIGFSESFFNELMKKEKNKRFDLIEYYLEVLSYDVFYSLNKAYGIEDEYEIREFEKIKLIYLKQTKKEL